MTRARPRKPPRPKPPFLGQVERLKARFDEDEVLQRDPSPRARVVSATRQRALLEKGFSRELYELIQAWGKRHGVPDLEQHVKFSAVHHPPHWVAHFLPATATGAIIVYSWYRRLSLEDARVHLRRALD